MLVYIHENFGKLGITNNKIKIQNFIKNSHNQKVIEITAGWFYAIVLIKYNKYRNFKYELYFCEWASFIVYNR